MDGAGLGHRFHNHIGWYYQGRCSCGWNGRRWWNPLTKALNLQFECLVHAPSSRY